MAQERTNRPKSAGASRRFFAPLRARRAEARRTRPTLRRPLPPRSAGRFPSRGARALRVSLRAGPAPRFARFPPPAFSPFLPRPPATRRALLPFLPSLPGGRAARFLPIFIPIPPQREKIFLKKCKTGATFWAFRVSIYIGACDRGVWPFRRVRRAGPAAAGGTAATGPARVPFGGPRSPAPAEETAARAVKRMASPPAR